ncbi:type II secretion system F family protein [Vibrio scophthalmi]|uniref:Type II secretion system protein GspF domain-containing protein n=1 Tax=Vibrio scophthalmi TaxID=45658 RepID=A0A1C7FJA7_9VIBR|nr:type II secretion system F family protein [Vibrio scophthalmi]ANU39404.1 hypothetical protein VSVS05_04369 [Vibrio scophthalmi]
MTVAIETLLFTRANQKELLEQWLQCEEDGLTVSQFCDLLIKHGDDSTKKIGKEGLEAPGKGLAFSDVLAKWCSPVVASTIASAESAGNRKVGIEAALNELSGGQNVMGRLFKIVAFPMLIVLAVGYLGVYVSGEILGAIRAPRGFAIDLRDFLQGSGVLTLAGIGFVLMMMGVSMPRWSGPSRQWVEGIPLYSHYRIGAAAGLLRTLYNLSSAGMNLNEALEVAAKNGTPYLRGHIKVMRELLVTENNIGKVLNSGLLLPRSRSNLEVLGESSQVTRLLDRAALYHQNEVTKRLNRIDLVLPKVILILAIVMLGVLIGSSMMLLLNSVQM